MPTQTLQAHNEKRNGSAVPFLFLQKEDTFDRLLEQSGHPHGQRQCRVIFVVLHRHNRLTADAEQPCEIFLPQAARLTQFFDIVLHRVTTPTQQ